MESQLQHLGKRWAAICTWTEQQWLLLQDVLLKWQHFSDEQVKFSDWLSQKEAILEKFQQSDLSDSDLVITQVKDLKVSLVIQVGLLFVCLMVFNATFNNISVISWRSIVLVEETGGPGENHRPITSH